MRSLSALALSFLVVLGLSPTEAAAGTAQVVAFRIGTSGVDVIDVSGAADSRIVTLPLDGRIYDTLYHDERLYVARGATGITVVDVSSVEQPRVLFTVGTGRPAVKLSERGSWMVVTHAEGPSTTYDLSQRGTPQLVAVEPPSPPSLLAKPSLPAAEVPLDDFRSLEKAGAVVLVIGGALTLIGGGLLYGSMSMGQAESAQQSPLACKLKDSSCPQWNLSGLAGVVYAIPGSLFLTMGGAGLITGTTLVVVGRNRRARGVELRAAPLRASSLGGAMPATLGTSLVASF